ncbi:MAG: SDR family NAD(P)-dependent oxidoreductase, partial [Pseudomonadota bacterium]
MVGRLEGRIALVTGASRGIGAAIAERYAAEGAHVILVARTVGGLEAVDDKIRAVGGTATLVPFDLTEFEKIDELGGAIYQRWGKLDILVGNAGILGELMPAHQMEPDLWQRTVDLNLTANWRLIRSLDPLLRASGTVKELRGHDGPVWRATFSGDGKRLVTASEDRTLRVWPITPDRGETVGQHAGPITAVATSADGWTVATGGKDGSLGVFDARKDGWQSPGPAAAAPVRDLVF